MSDVVWSVIIMIVILIILVAIALVYIFMYDEWYPNDGTEHGDQDSSLGSESRSHDDSYEGAYAQSSC